MPRRRGSIAVGAATLAISVGLAGPFAYAVATAVDRNTGSIPLGRTGGGRRTRRLRRRRSPVGSAAGPELAHRRRLRRRRLRQGTPAPAALAARAASAAPAAALAAAAGSAACSTPDPVGRAQGRLQADASKYTWVAATVGSHNAAGFQLATGKAVMAIGGFNGTDPTPTLAQFERGCQRGQDPLLHRRRQPGGAGAELERHQQLDHDWVAAHFTSKTIGGATVYDLRPPPISG